MDKGAAAMIGAVVLAGGQGKRMQAGMNKQYLTVEGRSVLSCAIESMAAVSEALIVVAAKGEEDKALVYGDFRKEGNFSSSWFKRPTPRQICKIQ